MSFIDIVLQKPSYGWADEKGELIVPTKKQMFKQAVSNINIFKTRKNWITLFGWMIIVLMLPFFYLFVTKYFSWQLLIVIIVYGTVIMGTHGTIWLHRYCTHRSFHFSHPIWRILTQNLVIKTVPEEMYVVSHHVHALRAVGRRMGRGRHGRYRASPDVRREALAPDPRMSIGRAALCFTCAKTGAGRSR